MRWTVACLVLLAGLLGWALLSRPAERPGERGVWASDDVAVAPMREDADERPRLLGTPRSEATDVAHEPAPEHDAGDGVCAAGTIARLIHEGTRIERLWGEHVLARASPAQRRQIAEAVGSLRAVERESRQDESNPSVVRVGIRLRFATARTRLLRDVGIDTRGLYDGRYNLDARANLEGVGACVYLDEIERDTLERLMAQGGSGLRLEDEVWLRRTSGGPGWAFLAASDPRPPDAGGPAVPFGAMAHCLPVVSADGRFVTVELLARVATVAPSPDGIVLRAFGKTTCVLPAGGSTLLMHVQGLLWRPPGARGPERHDRLILIQAYVD